ncbi:MAG: cytochrome c biogenesis protein [Candidatus Bipolaricaulia bacterium]
MNRRRIALLLLTAVLMGVNLYLIFIYAPKEQIMGDVQRIFYFHMPLAIISFLAFLLTFVSGILYLRSRDVRHDLRARASAEVGLVFLSLALITGSLWAKATWGVYWTWEPRLTTTFILWLMYVFYLTLRGYIEDREKMRTITAAYGVISFINVPIVFMSIRWWRTLHPVLIDTNEIAMEPPMVVALIFSIFTFVGLFALLLSERTRLAKLEHELQRAKERIKEAWR